MSKNLSARGKSWYMAVIVAGTAFLALSFHHVSWTWEIVRFVLIFAGLAFLLTLRPIHIFSESTFYWISDAALYAAIFLKGPAVGAWVAFIAMMAYEIYRLFGAFRIFADRRARLSWIWGLSAMDHRTLLMARAYRARKIRIEPSTLLRFFSNPFSQVVMVICAGLAYQNVTAGDHILSTPRSFLGLGVCVLAFFAVNLLINSLNTVFREDRPLLDIGKVWKSGFEDIALHLLMLGPQGILLALLFERQPAAALLLIVPIWMMHRSIENTNSIMLEAQNTIQAWARSLDERDHYTLGHSERVADIAVAIAQELCLSGEEVKQIRLAGKIHDIGKVDVPDRVLKKAERLDDEEFDVIKTHLDKVSEFRERLVNLGKAIPFELASLHHVHHDGRGYWKGNLVEKIPRGAGVLAVADAFDAMTSDRPYRKGLPEREACLRLLKASGTQFDPVVLEGFFMAYEKGAIHEKIEQWKEKEKHYLQQRNAEKLKSRLEPLDIIGEEESGEG
jgi:hypothetical protein